MRIDGCDGTEIPVVLAFGLPVFWRKSVFTPNENVFIGLVARMYHFDVTDCAEAHRLGNVSSIT